MGRRRNKRKAASLLPVVSSSGPMKAEDIRQVVAARYAQKLWAVHFEVGLCKWGRLRADVLAINMGASIDLIEIKSSVADFRADKKMGNYLKFADKAYLALTPAVYEKVKDKVLPNIGVLLVTPRSCWVAKRATALKVEDATRLNIMARVAYRSADVTLHERKSKTAGAKYVISKMLDAVAEVPKPRTRSQIADHVETQMKGLL